MKLLISQIQPLIDSVCIWEKCDTYEHSRVLQKLIETAIGFVEQ